MRRSQPDPTTEQVKAFLAAGCHESALLVAYRRVLLTGAGALAPVSAILMHLLNR